MKKVFIISVSFLFISCFTEPKKDESSTKIQKVNYQEEELNIDKKEVNFINDKISIIKLQELLDTPSDKTKEWIKSNKFLIEEELIGDNIFGGERITMKGSDFKIIVYLSSKKNINNIIRLNLGSNSIIYNEFQKEMVQIGYYEDNENNFKFISPTELTKNYTDKKYNLQFNETNEDVKDKYDLELDYYINLSRFNSKEM